MIFESDVFFVGIFFYICLFVGSMVDVMRFSLRLLSIFLVVMCVFQIPFSVFAMEDQTIQDESSIEPSWWGDNWLTVILWIIAYGILVGLGIAALVGCI